MQTDPTQRYYSPDYATARDRFREAVAARAGSLDSLELAAKGPAGESLSLDIGWFGAQKPRRVLVHSCGLHGVEAFAGSALQLQWLAQGNHPLTDDAAIILIHVLNPYGMAWLRRFNENNVDLNRNFLAMGEPFAGVPPGYVKLNRFLNPETPPSNDLFYLRAAALVARHGLASLRQAIAGGQHEYPKGLFFAGSSLQEGPAKLEKYLTDHLERAERIVAIDVHTGLGRSGDDALLVDGAPERKAVNQMMRAAFGESVQELKTTGMAYEVRGAQHQMYYRLFPGAQVYFASQEFGTYHPIRVLEALRAENRWHHHGSGTVEHPTKAALREVFNPNAVKWRRTILQRGETVLKQGLALAFEQSVKKTAATTG